MRNPHPRVMMVVPFYPYPVVGGLERQAHELAKALKAEGINVQAISGKFHSNRVRFEIVEDIPVWRIPLARIKTFRFIQTPFYLLWKLFQARHTFDVLHLHQFSWFGLFSILIAKCIHKPVITKLPNVGRHGIPGILEGSIGWLKLRILLLSDSIVAMSKQSILELEQVNFPIKRILTTPNGIRIFNYRQAISKPVSNICKVVFVGRLMPQKGIEDLLYAWRNIRCEKLNAQLEIWGSGPLQEELESLCMSLKISDSVSFLGHVSDVVDRLPLMDVFVLPSYAEGNSNAVLEAMMAGLPIICTHVGGTEMQVGADGASLMFHPGDRVTLASQLERLILNSDLRKQVGIKMRQRVEENFNIVHVANTYIRAYSLLAAHSRDGISEVGNPVVLEN
jgi:glycosyltransferase involved in cell wall biosynthesis